MAMGYTYSDGHGGTETEIFYTDREQDTIDEWGFALERLIEEPTPENLVKAEAAIKESRTEPVYMYDIEDDITATIKKMRKAAQDLMEYQEPEPEDLDMINRLLAGANTLLHHVPAERRREAA